MMHDVPYKKDDFMTEDYKGLSGSEVSQRVEAGKVNTTTNSISRTKKEITKIKRICKTSQFYLWEHKLPEDTPVRYDVVFIIGDECRLVRDAFSFFG